MPRSDAMPGTDHDILALAAVRQPLGAYLRLLWNIAPPLLHLPASTPDGGTGEVGEVDEVLAPFLSGAGLHLPAAPAGTAAVDAGHWYKAAAAHATAHLVFSPRVFTREGVAPITQALVGVLEDARVEALACRELPGLRRLWAPLHTVLPHDGEDFETLLLRLSRSLIDPGYDDPHPWVRKGRARFYLDGGGEVLAQAKPAALRGLASALGHDLGQMRMAFNPRRYRPGPSYRDDNRWLWVDAGDAVAAPSPAPAPSPAQAEADAASSAPPETLQWRHAEWDHRIGRLRPDWCTVTEGRPAVTVAITAVATVPAPGLEDIALCRRLETVLREASRQARVWRHRERDGDEIDLDEALRVAVATRSSAAGGERVHRRWLRAPASTAVSLLIDCSASSAQPTTTQPGVTRLALQQRCTGLLAEAMASVGWRLSIQGFCSDGRHGVRHWRVKDFDEPWTAEAAARLQGLESGLSTRLGAALRHACRALSGQRAAERLVLVMTDGEPHDIDIHDPRYLPEDARHAVQMARLLGIRSSCLLLDAEGEPAVRRIFGAGQGALLQSAAALPGVLARLLALRA